MRNADLIQSLPAKAQAVIRANIRYYPGLFAEDFIGEIALACAEWMARGSKDETELSELLRRANNTAIRNRDGGQSIRAKTQIPLECEHEGSQWHHHTARSPGVDEVIEDEELLAKIEQYLEPLAEEANRDRRLRNRRVGRAKYFSELEERLFSETAAPMSEAMAEQLAARAEANGTAKTKREARRIKMQLIAEIHQPDLFGGLEQIIESKGALSRKTNTSGWGRAE